jgi:hypothetical protein
MLHFLYLADLLTSELGIPVSTPTFNNLLWVGFGPETFFTGRQNELAMLQDYNFNVKTNIVVISGLGGVGKSMLAFQYARNKKDTFNCVWLRGDDKRALLHSVNNLALQLKVPAKETNCTQQQFEEMLIAIRTELNSINAQPWLFVLDNVEMPHEFIPPVLNSFQREPSVFIIVTSILRNVATKRRNTVLMELGGFSQEEATEFITQQLGESNNQLSRKLFTTLQGLPLAMEQAVGYITDQRCQSLKGASYGIQEFLDEFNNQKNAMEILDYELDENEKSIFETVKMCSDRIEALEGGEDTMTLLHVLSYLDPDGIPLSFLERLIRNMDRTIELSPKALTVLKNYSLISVEHRTITVHRIVQKTIPLLQFAAAQRLLQEVAVGTFRSLAVPTFGELYLCDRRQATVVWNHMKKDEDIMANFSKIQSDIVESFLEVDLPLLSSHLFLKELFGSISDVLDNKTDKLNLRPVFASQYISQLNTLMRLEDIQRTTTILIAKFGDYHPDVISAKLEIIGYQKELNMDVSYLEEFNTLIASAEKHLTKSHADVLTLKRNLAVCLYHDGKYLSVLDLFRDVPPLLKASDRGGFRLRNLELYCYNKLEDVVKVSELLEEQERKFEALRMDKTSHEIDSSAAKEDYDCGKKCFSVNEPFPEMVKLLYEMMLEVEKTKDTIELGCSVTIPEQRNSAETSHNNQREADVQQQTRETATDEAFLLTERKFKEVFTYERNLSKGMEILDHIKKYCFEVLL